MKCCESIVHSIKHFVLVFAGQACSVLALYLISVWRGMQSISKTPMPQCYYEVMKLGALKLNARCLCGNLLWDL